MDGRSFDALTKVLATGRSRRSVIKAIAAGFSGAIGAGVMRQTPEAAAGDVCLTFLSCCADCQEARAPIGGVRAFPAAQVSECCSGLVCLPSIEGGEEFSRCYECVAAEGSCSSSDECCGDLTCNEGTCGSVPACVVQGESCEINDDCCEDLVCDGEGTCQPPVVCTPESGECAADEECCEGICCGGICVDIQCCTDDENPNARCPEGTSCFEGYCDEISCREAGDVCEVDGDCCTELGCIDGICTAVSACIELNGACAETSECCGDAVCIDATCLTPRLPNTGTGQEGASLRGVMTPLATGAAAAIAAAMIRREHNPTEPNS